MLDVAICAVAVMIFWYCSLCPGGWELAGIRLLEITSVLSRLEHQNILTRGALITYIFIGDRSGLCAKCRHEDLSGRLFIVPRMVSTETAT